MILKYPTAILYLFIFSFSHAQEVKTIVDKYSFKMDEVLEVRFHINAQIDSMHVNEFKGFTVLYGPNTSNSMSFVNGIQKSNFMLSYGLRANKNGKIKIKSPTFFVEGKGLKGNVIKVKISKATKQGKKPEKKVVKGTHYS